MPYTELADGLPLYYTDQGSGPAVVLIHGWTMNSTFWAPTIEGLAADNRVIAIDLRGHGASGKTPTGHTLAQYARDIHNLLDHLNLAKASLVGWSMGTAVILSYVQQFGCDRLTSAVFVDQSPRFLNAEGWKFPLMGSYTPADLTEFVQTLQHARPVAMKPFIAACFAQQPDAATIDAAYAETTKTPTDSAIAIWMDMAHADLRPVLPDVTVPTLLIYGEQSAVFPGDLAGWYAQALPDAEVARFDHSGHAPFAEEPDAFNNTVGAFLSRTTV